MSQPFKDAAILCKTIMRNGHDAYIINTPLQYRLFSEDMPEIDIACEPPYTELSKLFPTIEESTEEGVVGIMEQDGTVFRFYHTDTENTAHPETTLMRISPHMLKKFVESGQSFPLMSGSDDESLDDLNGFADLSEGHVRLLGIPDNTLRRSYVLGIRALRIAANNQLPIEANTWLAIIRSASRILDYVPAPDIMLEWRKVLAEDMYTFIQLLFDSQLLHGFIPELAALSRIQQEKNDKGEMEDVLTHTIECMRRYPEELPYDWLGTLALCFHDIGKLYSAEYCDGKWNFYQHHRIGAKVARKILRRLHFEAEDIDLICHLIRHHMRMQFMMTDKGIRRFKALDEYPRLIEMARADIKAREAKYTSFNHNLKYLERAETPEQMLEPLLNGNEIMEYTGLKPGPHVGIIREELLTAQISGEVTSLEDAIAYVKNHGCLKN